MADQDSYMRKLRSMMERAASTEHEGERETCLRMAEKMAVEMSIDLATVMEDSEGRRIKPESFTFTIYAPHANNRELLFNAVMMTFNCKVLYAGNLGGGDRSYIAIGFSSDLDIAWTLCQSLDAQLTEELDIARPSLNGRNGAINFIASYSSRIRRRLTEFYVQKLEQSDQSTALVIRDRKDEVEQYVQDEFGVGKQAHRRIRSDSNASLMGRVSADNANIQLATGALGEGTKALV